MKQTIVAFVVFCLISLTNAGRSCSESVFADHNYNFGNQILYSQPPFSSFFYIIADSENGGTAISGDREFLVSYFRERKNEEWNTREFVWGRTLKPIGFDSVFISRYERMSRDHDSQFVLADLGSGFRLLLSEISTSDFSEFLNLQDLKSPYDYVFLTQLFIVLTRIDETIYFVHDVRDIIRAHEVAFGDYSLVERISNDNYDRFFQKYHESIKAPGILETDRGVEILLCIYDVDNLNVVRYEVLFEGSKLTAYKRELLIGSAEIGELLNARSELLRKDPDE